VNDLQALEQRRLALQSATDAAKTALERNRLGQFATPPALADDIVRYALTLLPTSEPVSFLEPSIGTGSFYSALLKNACGRSIERAVGYEIDPLYGGHAEALWQDTPLSLRLTDFTKVGAPQTDAERFNLIVSNPPYVRHHHLPGDEKRRLQALTLETTGLKLSQLAGLYCHFLLLCHAWLREGGVALWLIPSEFMDVNYGATVKAYFSEQVTLLRLHRFASEDVQFTDALVSSAVVCLKKGLPRSDHQVEVTLGGSLGAPKVSERVLLTALRAFPKWTQAHLPPVPSTSTLTDVKLRDLFDIRRGLATGDNGFFVLTPEAAAQHELPREFLRPILPSPRHLRADNIQADEQGEPDIDNPLYLLDCKLPESQVQAAYPALWRYLELGKEQGVSERYLCKNRTPWYAQENRPAAPFLCTYMGRVSKSSALPFRFILNRSAATAANAFLLLYPKGPLQAALAKDDALYEQVWELLSALTAEELVSEGRTYGGGLHKLEPKELANARAQRIADLIPGFGGLQAPAEQLGLFEEVLIR
jgi:adenine-specific DNA-methyltransferase